MSPSITAPAPRNVLLVEDETNNRRALTALMELEGWTVRPATTVREATEALREEKFSLVLLDLVLPDGDGVDVLKYVREHYIRTRVVVLTATSDPNQLAQAFRFQPSAMLFKPFHLGDLVRRLGGPAPVPVPTA